MPQVEDQNWSKGSNNRFASDRVPEGFVRELTNVDAQPDGTLSLRPGYAQLLAGTSVRGCLTLGNKALIADGTSLVEFDLDTNSSRTLATIAGAGAFTGDEMNGVLYFCTANESLRYDGSEVRQWGVDTVQAQPTPAVATGGALRAGDYFYAATRVNADGEEGGTVSAELLTVSTDGSKVTFTLPSAPSGGKVRVYMGFENSTELYLQGETSAATLTVTNLQDYTTTLETQFYTSPPQGQHVVAYNGVLLIARGGVLWMTHPMRPHLHRPAVAFVQYADDIRIVAPVEGGVYVVADQTYWVTGIETREPEQSTINAGDGTVAGSYARMPDGTAVWMTQYGLVTGDHSGNINYLSKENYVPLLAEQGASGIVERDGKQLAVTTMRGQPRGNSLAAGDYVDAEIIYP